jgi:hypothetical protein
VLSQTTVTQIVYVIAGTFFLAGAIYMQVSRSLALSHAAENDALTISFGQFKLQTLYPIVALFVIAFATMVCIPFYVYKTDADMAAQQANLAAQQAQAKLASFCDPVTVHLNVTPPVLLTGGEQLFVNEQPAVTVFKSSHPIDYVLAAGMNKPSMTVEFYFDPTSRAVFMTGVPGTTKQKIDASRSDEVWSPTFSLPLASLTPQPKPAPVASKARHLNPQLSSIKNPTFGVLR